MENDAIRVIEVSPQQEWADSVEGFLNQLGRASLLLIPGRDRTRTRALCTLLHGNESSGVQALHRYLRSRAVPRVDLICFVPGVETSLHEALFRHRYIPGERDMNRCFRPPWEDRPGQVAQRLLQLLQEYWPECLIDIHNTSGSGPAFGVVAHEEQRHEALVALFTRNLVVTDLRLGALMELSAAHCPIVTVECGGTGDPRAEQVAWEGLQRYAAADDVLAPNPQMALELYHHPVRLELRAGCRLAYGTRPVAGADLTVPPDLERYNFGTAPSGTFIGWLAGQEALDCLCARNGQGDDQLWRLFRLEGMRLLTAQPLRLFMITHRVDIALSDCLLYAAPEAGHSRLPGVDHSTSAG